MTFIEKLRYFWGGKGAQRRASASAVATFQEKYANFQDLLASNTELLQIISDIERKLRGQTVFGQAYLDALSIRTIFHTARMVRCLEKMSGRPYPLLDKKLPDIFSRIKSDTVAAKAKTRVGEPLVLPYTAIRRETVDLVGGKNANLGEVMNALALPTPRGFAITTAAFRYFIQANGLNEPIQRLKRKADLIETETIVEVSQTIQERILAADVPEDLARDILDAYDRLALELAAAGKPVNVSLRSSALGEDSMLSFAGQYLTVLNVPPRRILDEYKRVLASLFSAHAISYRLHMAITFEDAVMAVARRMSNGPWITRGA